MIPGTIATEVEMFGHWAAGATVIVRNRSPVSADDRVSTRSRSALVVGVQGLSQAPAPMTSPAIMAVPTTFNFNRAFRSDLICTLQLANNRRPERKQATRHRKMRRSAASGGAVRSLQARAAPLLSPTVIRRDRGCRRR
jgi:hypothetical protein